MENDFQQSEEITYDDFSDDFKSQQIQNINEASEGLQDLLRNYRINKIGRLLEKGRQKEAYRLIKKVDKDMVRVYPSKLNFFTNFLNCL